MMDAAIVSPTRLPDLRACGPDRASAHRAPANRLVEADPRFADPDLAQDYVSRYGDLWHRTRGAPAFLRWLHTHPKVMAERAAVLEWREALLRERDYERRGRIVEREEAAAKRIDDGLSEEIVVTRTDRSGRPVLPWLHSEA